MPDKHKEKTIIQYGIRGVLAGLATMVLYIMSAILFNDSVVCTILYNIALFFGKPLFFIFPEEQFTDYMLEGAIKFIISALLAGFLYGIIVGGIVKGVRGITKWAMHQVDKTK